MKRLFVFLFALTFAIPGNIPAVVLAQTANTTTPFSDVYTDDEYIDDIWYLKDKNIVQGYEFTAADGTKLENQFRSDYELNRAELTKIMIEAQFSSTVIDQCLQDKVTKGWTEVYFPDVKITDWFAKYVCVAKEKGVIDGYPDGTFKPAEPVNFVEAAKIIANTLDLNVTIDSSTDWYVPFVKAMVARKGAPESIRSFGKLLTRGEMARMIHAGKEILAVPSLTVATLTELNAKEPELPQVDTCNVLIEQLSTTQEAQNKMYGPPAGMGMAEDVAAPTTASPETSGGTANEAPIRDQASADDYSQTNTQVAGVDEADIVKNDGKYIYLIKGNSIRIVSAYPGNQMQEVSSIVVDDQEFAPLEMYVDNNQLVIIGNVYRNRYYGEPMPMDTGTMDSKMAIWPGPYFDQTRTKVYLYDITNRSLPKKQRSIEIEGNYSSSRKVGKNVYFVLNQAIPYYEIQAQESANVLLPRFIDSAEGNVEKPLVRCMGVQYFPHFQDRSYLIVAGLNIADLNSDISRKVLLGSSQNIFASETGLYVASPQYREVRKTSGSDIYFDTEQTTLVYHFNLNQAMAEYQNQATVPGTILNQFSMDEMGTTFRIATESNGYNYSTGESSSSSGLYVLDKAAMNVTGKIEGIAPNEHIKSVRFMGNRAYMVTFVTVDPLFVIDLSDKTNPKIVGELKIPGWSDYLHPYDETHLIGFGRDVDPKIDADMVHSDYAVYYTALLGMKISMFDVSDVANPKEMFHEIIGTRGTNSELLTNHKALLFDKSKNLLAFPITITEAGSKDSSGAPLDINTVFSGGIIYSVDLVNGFQLKGKVTHYENNDVFLNSGEYFYGEPGRMIQRMLYIGEYLYSVSPDYVRSYMLSTAVPVNFIQLKGDQTPGVDYLPQ